MVRVVLVLAVVLAAACRDKPSGDTPVAAQVAPEDRCDPRRNRVCVGNDVVACEPDGALGRRLQACHDGCTGGRCNATCADDGVQLIYVVDSAHQLLSFDPRKLPGDPFRRIGRLDCRARAGGPYSMSIDRHGTAWVIYDDGELFQVSITDAHCEPVDYRPGATGFVRFGMGFATDAPGSDREQLYLSVDDGDRALGVIDPARGLTAVRIGDLDTGGERSPELTGTRDARLYGFYPVRDAPSYVQEIDRATGQRKGPRWPPGDRALGEVNAWAFAQWAGVFYVFVTTAAADGHLDSSVRAVDRTTGSYRTVLSKLPTRITGAGVSTCAPERDR